MKNFLREGERLDDLMRSGRVIIQDKNEFCFSMDAVLIAHFPRFKKISRVIVREKFSSRGFEM